MPSSSRPCPNLPWRVAVRVSLLASSRKPCWRSETCTAHAPSKECRQKAVPSWGLPVEIWRQALLQTLWSCAIPRQTLQTVVLMFVAVNTSTPVQWQRSQVVQLAWTARFMTAGLAVGVIPSMFDTMLVAISAGNPGWRPCCSSMLFRQLTTWPMS